MNKLNELIHTLCPKGVLYRELREISEMKRGTSVTKKDITVGDIPVISGGKEPAYFCDTFNRTGETITVAGSGAGAGFVQYWTTPIFVCDAFTVKGCKTVSTKYLYYCLTNMQERIYSTKKGGGVPHVHISSIENFKIPVPPLAVQNEIVHILDGFTAVTDKLALELALELSARRKQLTYYREKMINQGNNTVKLAEICDIFLGLTATPDYTDSGVKFISAQNTSSDYLDLERVKYISEEDYRKATSNAKPQRGDVLFTRVGSNLGHPVIVDTDERLCIFVSLGFLRIKENSLVLNRYLRHWMNTDLFWDQVRKNVHGAAKVNLNTGWLKDFEIPLPPIEKQQEVCDFLEHLEEMCSNLTADLALELETRKKQYSFYQNRLLTFKELNAQ